MNSGNQIVAIGTVTELVRAPNGSFRYYGKIKLSAPNRYRGREIGLFVISHEHDVRDFIGKSISASFENDELTRSVEPHPDPFSFSQPEPQLPLEYQHGDFAPIDYVSYTKAISAHGVIRDLKPKDKNEGIYFIFDMGYEGDMVSVEIMEPAKYKGTVIHVLVFNSNRIGHERSTQWREIGEEVAFNVPESTLAWEPWGFLPYDEMDSVTFTSNAR